MGSRQDPQGIHVKGTCNPSDIFTEEMKDGAHFRRLRDSFSCLDPPPSSRVFHLILLLSYQVLLPIWSTWLKQLSPLPPLPLQVCLR